MKFLQFAVIILFVGCQSPPKELPVLSYRIDASGAKTFYHVSYDNFINQRGSEFSTENIDGKVVIANFFFTRCPSICPPMREVLIEIAESFEGKDDFLIISHTIDPENDSVEVLNNYSESTGIPSENWKFLRADVETTRQQANQYMTNFRPNEDGTDFYHSSYVALVDTERQIRGFYNILVESEVERLIQDISLLLK